MMLALLKAKSSVNAKWTDSCNNCRVNELKRGAGGGTRTRTMATTGGF